MIVHTLPSHENAGKMVRVPNVLPCVLDVAPRSEMRMLEMGPWGRLTVI